MRIVGPRAEVEMSSDANGHLLEIVYKKATYYIRFVESEEIVAVDFARIFAGTSDLATETVESLWKEKV